MIAVIQRVDNCSVTVDGATVSSIGRGLLVLLGVHRDDTEADIAVLVRKTAGLRVFSDSDDKMNLSIRDVNGSVIVVSQFTLFGDVRRGLRPYFGDAADPAVADEYYRRFMALLGEEGIDVQGGVFGAHMDVELVNNGPVTIILNSGDLR